MYVLKPIEIMINYFIQLERINCVHIVNMFSKWEYLEYNNKQMLKLIQMQRDVDNESTQFIFIQTR